MSQYFENVTVYDEYGNDLGSFEIESDSSFDSRLEEAIENGVGVAVDKYIDYLKQKERKEQAIRSRQSWEQRGARVGVSMPSYVNSTAAFEGLIIQREQATYKRKVNAIAKARARARQAENRASKPTTYNRPSSSSSSDYKSIINSESSAVARARAKLLGNRKSATYSQPKQKTYQEKDHSNFKKYIDEKVDLTDRKHKTEIKSKTDIPLNWIPAIVKENSIMYGSPNKSSETLYYLNKKDEIYIKPSDAVGQFMRATKLSENKDGFIEMSMIELK